MTTARRSESGLFRGAAYDRTEYQPLIPVAYYCTLSATLWKKGYELVK